MTGKPASDNSPDPPDVPPRVDTSVPHPARRYNYWLGGKDHFAADRTSGDEIAKVIPTIRTAVRENRAFLRRAVRFLAGEAGIQQFLDIGTGIPGPDNTHEVAQSINPACTVVYVDNDPVVLAHARALLTSTPQGRTAYIDADAREPKKIITDPEVRSTLDFTQPIGVLLIAILHFIPDEHAYPLVGALIDAVPAGSHLAISHATVDHMGAQQRKKMREQIASGRHGTAVMRSREQFGRFFDGLELVLPGITSIAGWRAENEPKPRPTDADCASYGAVAVVP